MGNRLPLTGIFTQSPEILIFDYAESTDSILTDTVMYHIDDSLTYPYDTAVYVVLTAEEFALDTNINLGRTGTALHSLEFADNSRYVYFTRNNIRGSMAGYATTDSNFVNDSITNTGGNIRRGEDGLMYAGLRNGMRTISNASSLTPTIDFEDFGIASVNYNMFGSGSSPQLLKTGPISVMQKGIYTRTLNQKYYELSDHLGNVRAVVKDYKEKKSGNLWPSPVSYADYYAFGMMLPSRNANPGDYRFGYNGKENDNEVKGASNQQDYGMRIYDPRIGRFLSVDPLSKQFPWLSTYQYASNNPILYIDLDGLEGVRPGIRQAPRIGMRTYNSINQNNYNVRRTYQPNNSPGGVAPVTQYQIFEETGAHGTPQTNRGNTRGQVLNIFGEGIENIKDYKSKINEFTVTQTVFNAGEKNEKEYFDIKFTDFDVQMQYEKSEAEYWATFDREMEGVKPALITDFDMNNPIDYQKYASQNAAYALKYSMARYKLGPSPKDQIVQSIKNAAKSGNATIVDNTSREATVGPAN